MEGGEAEGRRVRRREKSTQRYQHCTCVLSQVGSSYAAKPSRRISGVCVCAIIGLHTGGYSPGLDESRVR